MKELREKIKQILLDGCEQSYSSVIENGEFKENIVCCDRDIKLLKLFKQLLLEREKEVSKLVICSALKTRNGMIIKGHRHADCIRGASEITSLSRDDIIMGEQGFITSENKFVSREEAHQIHFGKPGKLFSEDIY